MKRTVAVDKVGRLVLPKPVREAIGISGSATARGRAGSIDGAGLISNLSFRASNF